MTGHGRDVENYAKLRNVEMEKERSNAIWREIESSVSSTQAGPFNNRRYKRWATVGVACATCFIVVGGIFMTKNYVHEHPPVPPSTSTRGVDTQSPEAAELIYKDWRVVFVKSLLKSGPYYDINLYYEGKKAVEVTDFKLEWEGGTSSTGGASLEPGALVSGFPDVKVPSGLNQLPPLTVSWVDGSPWVNPKSYSETIDLSHAKSNLQLTNYHAYFGRGANWDVSYAYDTVVGSNFNHSYGTFILQYKGKHIGNQVTYTLRSKAGTLDYILATPQDRTVMSVDPRNKGYDITSSSATITIKWGSKTETVTLHRQR